MTEASYDGEDQLTSYGTSAYVFDSAGDLESVTDNGAGGTSVYLYDALGALASVRLGDGRMVEYTVDGMHRRVAKKIDGVLQRAWLYFDGFSPIAELDAAGNVEAVFVYGERVGTPEYMVKDGATYRILSDHLGSVRLVVNVADGSIAQRIDYDEFGVVLLDTNPGFQPLGFGGGLYDADSGLVKLGARDYDARTGRWTRKDPLLFSGGDANLYAFSLGDPINRVDPSGLRSDDFTIYYDEREARVRPAIPGSSAPPVESRDSGTCSDDDDYGDDEELEEDDEEGGPRNPLYPNEVCPKCKGGSSTICSLLCAKNRSVFSSSKCRVECLDRCANCP